MRKAVFVLLFVFLTVLCIAQERILLDKPSGIFMTPLASDALYLTNFPGCNSGNYISLKNVSDIREFRDLGLTKYAEYRKRTLSDVFPPGPTMLIVGSAAFVGGFAAMLAGTNNTESPLMWIGIGVMVVGATVAGVSPLFWDY